MATLEFSERQAQQAASALPRWSPRGHAVAVTPAQGVVVIWTADMSEKLKEYERLNEDIQVRARLKSDRLNAGQKR